MFLCHKKWPFRIQGILSFLLFLDTFCIKGILSFSYSRENDDDGDLPADSECKDFLLRQVIPYPQIQLADFDFSIGWLWFPNWLNVISQLADDDFTIGKIWFPNWLDMISCFPQRYLQGARCSSTTATSDCWPADFSGRQSVAQNAAHSPAFVYISSLFFFLFLKSILNFSLGI